MCQIQYAEYTEFTSITLRNSMTGEHQKDNGQFSQPHKTAVLHGAVMMISRNVSQHIGFMTEVYFLFYKEFDWSTQIRRAGYHLWYESSAIVYHKESMTAKRGTLSREYYLSRTRILFACRNIYNIKKYLSCLYISAV